MFIICPKCSAKYRIPEGITLDNGQKLKCSACGLIFTKGEEAPLILEKPVISNVSDKITATPTVEEAFSTPLYTQPTDLDKIAPADSLPEAFQPVSEPPKKKSHIWIILLYLIVITSLCAAGWMYRDMLKPSLGDFLHLTTHKTTPSTHTRRTTPTVVPKQVHKPTTAPQNKAAIAIEKPKAEEKKLPVAPVKKEVPVTEKKPLVTNPAPPVTAPTPDKPVLPAAIPEAALAPVSPAPGIEEIIEETALPEEVEQPLFEDSASAPTTALKINQVTFQIKPDETGAPQLLVEGSVQNTSQTVQSVPTLIVQVFNKNKDVLAEKNIHIDSEKLNPNQAVPFYTGITPVPTDVDHVDVKL